MEELKKSLSNPENWYRTILSAALTGGALAAAGAYSAPSHVNFFTDEGWKNLWQIFVSGAVLGIINLWVRSPKDQSKE